VINPADNSAVVLRSDILNTYVGQKVRLDLEALDVIHSFWVPAMRIKQDLMPGRTTDVTFTVVAPDNVAFNEAGYIDFPVVCAELCGSGHGQMRATVRVWETEQLYIASFYTPSVDAVLNPPADPVLRGAGILASGAYPCANCHALNFEGPNGITFDWQGNQAPSLNGIAERATLRVPSLTPEEYLKQSLDNPHAFLVPGYGPLMPDFQSEDPQAPNFMPSTDLAAIVGFLCTVSDTGEVACTIDPAEIGASAEATAEATDTVISEATETVVPVSETTETPVPQSEATAEATEAP
jgi:cytochrome c oxidase subunit 2